MNRFIAAAAVSICAMLPMAAQAQAKEKMMKPTMEQCEGGYQKTYMKSMKWSKGKFDRSCRTMMRKSKT